MAFIEGWPHLRGGLYEGFHCNLCVHRGEHSFHVRGCKALFMGTGAHNPVHASKRKAP